MQVRVRGVRYCLHSDVVRFLTIQVGVKSVVLSLDKKEYDVEQRTYYKYTVLSFILCLRF